MASYYKCKVPMPGTVRDPSPRVSATGCEDGRRLSVGTGGQGHAPTQILISDDDPSPRVSATGCEDSRRLSMGSGGRGHAPTQILISSRAGERGHAPYQNADLEVIEGLQKLCPKPRAQEYSVGPVVPVVPDWAKVKDRNGKRTDSVKAAPKIDLYKVAEDMNVYSRQKRGGFRSLVVPDFPYCILCSNGAFCLGSGCKGPKPAATLDKQMFGLYPRIDVKKKYLPGMNFVESPLETNIR